MFNSNLTSSITGWFSNTFQNNDEENIEVNNKNLDATKPLDGSTEVSEPPAEATEAKTAKANEENEENKDTKQDAEPNAESTTETSVLDLDTEQMQKKLSEETQKMMSSAKSFGSYIFGVASEATKKVSSTMNETASTLKKTMEEKTILGDLNREQDDFIRKKRERQGGDAVPPWYGYHEEAEMKKQILALSNDSRNFLRSPPSGVQFQFDFEQMFPVAMATLKEDDNLNKMRFKLVPTKIKEEMFWKNYFYRVSLIKQSAQLSTLTEMQKSATEVASSESSASSIVLLGGATGSISRTSSSKSLNKNEADKSSSSTNQSRVDVMSNDLTETQEDLPPAEFVSDAFDPSLLNPDDLEREMKELGMDNNEELPEWEQELQKELQDYEVVQGKKDEAWEQELNSMLTSEVDS